MPLFKQPNETIVSVASATPGWCIAAVKKSGGAGDLVYEAVVGWAVVQPLITEDDDLQLNPPPRRIVPVRSIDGRQLSAEDDDVGVELDLVIVGPDEYVDKRQTEDGQYYLVVMTKPR